MKYLRLGPTLGNAGHDGLVTGPVDVGSFGSTGLFAQVHLPCQDIEEMTTVAGPKIPIRRFQMAKIREARPEMKRFLRNNGLSITLFILFLTSLVGQAMTGWRAYTAERHLHDLSSVGFIDYLATGHFISATFENWESEFLQMSVYVFLTVFLFQKGSPESKDPDQEETVDESLQKPNVAEDAPAPVHRGGLLLKLYSHSLSLALVALFLTSFWLHLAGSTRRSNEDALWHGQRTKAVTDTLIDPEFWYESFQNWQSEFLSIGVLLVLGIFLRERGSPESKPVAASHSVTGH